MVGKIVQWPWNQPVSMVGLCKLPWSFTWRTSGTITRACNTKMGAPLMSARENGEKQLQVYVKRLIEKEKRKENEWTMKIQTITK